MKSDMEQTAVRYHDMDALRAVAMILGIALHGALSFVPFPWSVQDSEQHEVFGIFFVVIHGFRMPVFFVMSGFFTAMLWRRRGLGSILKQRFLRVFLPCMLGIYTICSLQDWVGDFVHTESPPEWPFEVEEAAALESERAESLPLAAKLGQRAVVEELLATGTDVNTRDDWGATALHWAAVTGEGDITRTLIDEGADVNAKTQDGSLPLHWAAFLGEPDIVEFLLEAGADPSVRNQKRETPLDTIRAPWTREMTGAVEWVAGIMQIEVDVDRVRDERPAVVALLGGDSDGAGGFDLPNAAKRGDLDAVRALLEKDADTETRMEDKSSALHWSAVQGHYEIVEALLEAGADRNVRHEDGGTPLHWTAFLGESEMVELLLSEGADPNIKNYNGQTPLDTISASWEELRGITEWIAGIMQLEVDLDEIKDDRPAVIAALKAGGAEGADFGRRIEKLFLVNVFHHLWFLWFLCFFVVAFAAYALFASVVGLKRLPKVLINSPLRYIWLLPLTLIPQLMMRDGEVGGFGPDTSTGWLPFPHLLLYYWIFFFFGVLYFDTKEEDDRLGSWWWLTLPLALFVVFPLASRFLLEDSWSQEEGFFKDKQHLIGCCLEVLFVWLMIFGSMGFFQRFFNSESRVMRYVSDSSYWLYLAHLPLIMLGQWFVRDWPLSPFIKFPLVCVVVTGLLLLSYQTLVRYTPIGVFLNGRRKRPVQASVAVD